MSSCLGLQSLTLPLLQAVNLFCHTRPEAVITWSIAAFTAPWLLLTIAFAFASLVLAAGATIHTVAGLWMNVKPRSNIPVRSRPPHSSIDMAAALTQAPVSLPPLPVPVGAAAFSDDSSSNSNSTTGGTAAAAAAGSAPAGKCPFSGALGALTGSQEAQTPAAPAL